MHKIRLHSCSNSIHASKMYDSTHNPCWEFFFISKKEKKKEVYVFALKKLFICTYSTNALNGPSIFF